jgi:hypothetical protein
MQSKTYFLCLFLSANWSAAILNDILTAAAVIIFFLIIMLKVLGLFGCIYLFSHISRLLLPVRDFFIITKTASELTTDQCWDA